MSIYGKPKYEQSSEKITYHKLGHKTEEQRTLIVRIAPPINEAAQTGEYQRFIKQHYGISLPFTDGQGKARTFPATYNCPEVYDFNNKVVKVACAECTQIKVRKASLEAKKEELKKAGKSTEDIAKQLEFLSEWSSNHNLDKKWYLIAKNQAGKWGYLTISHKCQKRLKTLFAELEAQGIGPMNPENGVWLKFTRVGTKFNEIEDYVEVLKERVDLDGKKVLMEKYDTLVQADEDQLVKIPALSSIGRPVTPAQVEQIVNAAYDEAIVREVLNIPARRAAGAAETPGDEEEPGREEEPAKVETKAQPAAPKAIDKVAELEAQLAALKAVKAAAEPTKGPAAPGPGVAAALNLGADDFLKSYEKQQ